MVMETQLCLQPDSSSPLESSVKPASLPGTVTTGNQAEETKARRHQLGRWLCLLPHHLHCCSEVTGPISFILSLGLVTCHQRYRQVLLGILGRKMTALLPGVGSRGVPVTGLQQAPVSHRELSQAAADRAHCPRHPLPGGGSMEPSGWTLLWVADPVQTSR